ncbi:MAG: AI-2E family transporter [Clostridia bacterium]|nr:AI-2E family transporter [Clostridia bacterium]
MKKIEWKSCLKIGISLFILYLSIHYWPKISGIIALLISAAAPLVVGFIIAYPVNILLSFYERHFFPKSTKKIVLKMRTGVCLAGAIITLLGIIALIIGLIAPQLANCAKMLYAEIPGVMEYVTKKLNEFDFVPEDIINSLSAIDWKSKIGDIAKTVTSGLGSVMDVAVTAVSSVFSTVSNFVLGFIFALYLLLSKNKLTSQLNKLAEHFLPEKVNKNLNYVFSVANDCFHKFIVGQCTEAVILGTLCMIGMLVLRLPYAPMIGALVAFTALIPVVGGFIGAGVGAFLILMESPMKALIFLIFIIILQQLEGDLIYPKVVGQSIGLPGIWVLAAVTVGAGIMGISGMLLGVPIAATAYRIIKRELGDEPIFNKIKKDEKVIAENADFSEDSEESKGETE